MDSKITKFLLSSLLTCLCISTQLLFAQSYVCKIFQNCKTGDTITQALLYTRYYSPQNTLLKEIEYDTLDSTKNTIRINQYNQNHQIIYSIDSSRFRKTNTQYIYDKNVLKEKIIISSFLSTENNTQKSNEPNDDSVYFKQSKITYVILIDTSGQKYHYNKDGLIEKIIQCYKNDFAKRTEFFEYNKLNQLIQSTYSDQYRFRYFYNEKGALIKKEKYENRYIDLSSIGPYFKSETERLNKAIWELETSEDFIYTNNGILSKKITSKTIGYPSKTIESYQYDEKGRLIESTSMENNTNAPCIFLYQYSTTPKG